MSVRRGWYLHAEFGGTHPSIEVALRRAQQHHRLGNLQLLGGGLDDRLKRLGINGLQRGILRCEAGRGGRRGG